MKKHLAIFSPAAVKQIFAGKKNVETRFSQKKIAPFGVVSKGDLVYIKPTGKEIAGQFLVKKVLFFDGLDSSDWSFIKDNYSPQISFGEKTLDNRYYQEKTVAKFGTLIFMDQVEQFITSPIKINKTDRRGWMVLEERGKP